MNKLKILLLEDEVLTARDIEEQLTEVGYFVCGIARSYEEAMELYQQHIPDLLLLDIKIQGKRDGIDLARTINSFSQVPVIFLTGNEDQETLARAKKTLPVAFILKPFRPNEFITNVDLAVSNFVRSQRLHNPSVVDAIFLPARDKGHIKVPVEDISYIKGDGAYVKVYTSDQEVLDVATNLSTFMRQISLSHFARVSRNHVINIQHLTKLDQSHVWVGDIKLSIGSGYRKELKQSLRFIRTKL
jgi:DNA-binding LytR/AlgR family response regulator